MRDIGQIKEVNENPHGDHGEEHFGTRHVGSPETHHQTKGEAIVNGIITDIILGAALEALLFGPTPRKQPEPMERIHSAIDAQPPFLKFWAKLNARLEAEGRPEASYGQAKEAWSGGKTPKGALTFIGKEFDGLRAVPSKPVTYHGGPRPSYHGEHREVTGEGAIWHKVTGPSGPIVYACPEAALVAAKDAKAALIEARFR